MISLFILSLSIAVTINFTPLYSFDIDYLEITETLKMPKEQISTNYRILLNYLNMPWIAELNMPDFPSSARGLFHFVEVKKLFALNYLILLFSGVGTFGFVRYLSRRQQSWQLLLYFRREPLFPLLSFWLSWLASTRCSCFSIKFSLTMTPGSSMLLLILLS